MNVRVESVACIILAAGMSIRFGSAKLLSELQGKTLLQRAIDTANNSAADYVILVVGAYASRILAKTQTGRAQVVFNNKFDEGQSSSIKCGISNLPKDCSAAIIMVADQPFLKSEYLDKMIQIFRTQGSSRKIIALSEGAEPRNPVLVGKEIFPELMKLEGDVGARAIIRHSRRIKVVPVDDPKAFLDIDDRRNIAQLKVAD